MRNTQPPLGTPLNISHPLSQGLVGCWLLNEGGGQIAVDSVNLSNPGTLTNGPRFAVAQRGQCVALDGSNDYISVNNTSSALNFAGPITLSAWVYPQISNAYQGVIVKATGVNNRQYAFYLSQLGTGNIYVAFAGSNIGDQAVSPAWTVNAWNHIVVTADGSNIKIYINGVLASTLGNANVSATASGNVVFGMDVPNNQFPLNGYMGPVFIYNRAISASEVRQLYANSYQMFQQAKPLN